MPADPVVAFYSGGFDNQHRTLEQLWSWSDDRLEAVHDYIQWMFPTVQPSGVNPFAPLVTPDTIAAFDTKAALRTRLRRSLDRMLSFYGFRRVAASGGPDRIEIDPARFPDRAATWLHPGNHNHLRLTRIMECLSALGLPAEGRALQQCLLAEVCEGPGRQRVTRSTVEFWRRVSFTITP
jgi:Opioid growth factor receptor (OGFr) conserved region